MRDGLRILGLVPARSGSKGIPDKNMVRLGGLSLIARAGLALSQHSWIDRCIISTDSQRYADEGAEYGLEAPFLRPAELSADASPALDTFVHALTECERLDGRRYDLVVVAEPTSPLREPSDLEVTVARLLETGADAALTVSRVDAKAHPHKVFTHSGGRLRYFSDHGARVTSRQSLGALYARNGLAYCYRRDTLLAKRALITEETVAVVTERPVANIDEPIDLLWAEFLLYHMPPALIANGLEARHAPTVEW
jgi:CMP-N-acetylneuraminic acid synthetase